MLQNLDDRTPIAKVGGEPTEYFMDLVQRRGNWLKEALDVTRAVPPHPFYPLDADAMGIDPYAIFYVSPSGSDTNDGLTAATPWLTFDYAIGYISRLRWPKWSGLPSLQLADGAYYTTASLDFDGFPLFLGSDGIGIYGNNGDPTAVTLDTNGWLLNGTVNAYFNAITFSETDRIRAHNGAALHFSNCRFTGITGGNTRANFWAYEQGSIRFSGSTTLAYSASQTVRSITEATDHSRIDTSGTITVSGSPTVVDGFARIKNLSSGNFYYDDTITNFSGTVTGPRFLLEEQSTIYTNDSGLSYLPGTTAGNQDAGSWYDAFPGGSGNPWGPVVDGSFPPVFVQNPDGSLVLAEYV